MTDHGFDCAVLCAGVLEEETRPNLSRPIAQLVTGEGAQLQVSPLLPSGVRSAASLHATQPNQQSSDFTHCHCHWMRYLRVLGSCKT
jgi:hypothetical protein